MAVQKKTVGGSARSSGGRNSGADAPASRGRGLIFFLALLFLIAVAVGFALLLWRIPEYLMLRNRRFVLRRVEVHSTGYWQGRGQELASRIGIAPGDPLFAIRVGDVRRKLKDLQNIEDAEAQLVLPDMLVVKLTERVPRAVVEGGVLVIDEHGQQFKRSESTAAGQKLPVITGMRVGNVKEQFKPALALIMAVIRGCKDIVIEEISVRNPHFLEARVTYRNHRTFRVKFPVDAEDYEYLLLVLQNAILRAAGRGDDPAVIDLRYKGQAVYEP